MWVIIAIRIKCKMDSLMFKSNTISTILALKGSGKSVLTEYLWLQNRKSCIIFDINGTYGAFKNRVFINGNHALGAFRAIKQVLNRYADCKVDIVITDALEIDPLLSLIWSEFSHLCIVIDEVDMYYSAFIPRETALFSFINRGRHKCFDLICNARRPAKIPRDLTSQSDYIYLGFVGREPLDLKYFREVFGSLDKIPKERFKWAVFDSVNQEYHDFVIPKRDYSILQRGC